jgi:hypothetical protein
LSDFEVMDGEEDDIFVGKDENVIREARKDTNEWFQIWDKTGTSNIGVDDINN